MKTLTKADMIEALIYRQNLNKHQAREVVDGFFDVIVQRLHEGHDVKLSGFGNFDLKDKAARPGRNPKTGEEVEVSARRVVTFRAGQKFRGRLSKD